MLSAGECEGRQVGEGRGGHRDSTKVGEPAKSPQGSGRGRRRKQSCPRPLVLQGSWPTGLFYCRHVLFRVWWGTSSLSPPLS